MTKTPLTDALDQAVKERPYPYRWQDYQDLARSLELSLSQAREERDRLAAALAQMEEGFRMRCNFCGGDLARCNVAKEIRGACSAPDARELLAQHAAAKEGK